MVLLNQGASTAGDWDQRAATTERLVLQRFINRYRRLPGTSLARTVAPTTHDEAVFVVDGSTPFHYWWQAHLLDAIVDGGWRRLRAGDEAGAGRSATLGHRLLSTIWLRNRGTLRNHFFDDMAWLTLAVERLAALDARVGKPLSHASLAPTRRMLTRQLDRSLDGAGAVVWNRDRNFHNAATAGPVALHLARSGRTKEARRTIEWVFGQLWDPERGLIRDGIRRGGDVVEHAYTYNQGTVLAVLLQLGQPHDLQRASALVRAIGHHLTRQAHGRRVLITHGGGDGGLFTGILGRYLSIAGRDQRLEVEARQEANGLVRATGDVLWENRDPATGLFPPWKHNVELSTQLQGWLIMQAAARLDA